MDTPPDPVATPLSPAPARDGLPLVVVERNGAMATTGEGERRHGFLYRFRFLPLIPLLIATGGIIGLYFQPPGLQFVMHYFNLVPGAGTSSPIAVPVAPKPLSLAPARIMVVGLGKILPEGEVITVAPPYGAGDARIASLNVGEGDRINKGDILVTLDNEPTLQSAVTTAAATVSTRAAALEQVRASVKASREEATARLAGAEAVANNAETDLARAESLLKTGVTTTAAVDQKRTARDSAVREVETIKATLSRFSGEIDSQPDVIVAARNLDAARADLSRAEADLERSHVRAPMAGTVLSIKARPGEKPGADGIMNIANLDAMNVEVEVYQTDIGLVDVGQKVEVEAEALPQVLNGTVKRIGLEVGRQSIIDVSPAASTDARVVKVTVALDPASVEIARRFTNLQVTARILLGNAP